MLKALSSEFHLSLILSLIIVTTKRLIFFLFFKKKTCTMLYVKVHNKIKQKIEKYIKCINFQLPYLVSHVCLTEIGACNVILFLIPLIFNICLSFIYSREKCVSRINSNAKLNKYTQNFQNYSASKFDLNIYYYIKRKNYFELLKSLIFLVF